MSDQVSHDVIRSSILAVLGEAFEGVTGYFLDEGTSLFQTLESVTAEEASRAASPIVGTVAAQVAHIAFYLDTTIRFVTVGFGDEHPDWGSAWKVTAVTDAEWNELRANLRTQYDRTRDMVSSNEYWNERSLGGAVTMVAHCAYHLGEIRQALGVIRA